MNKVCDDYLDLEGRCFLDDSWCLFPCDPSRCTNGCYSSSGKDLAEYTPGDVREKLGIKKGDFICEKFISAKDLLFSIDPYACAMEKARSIVKEMAEKGYRVNYRDLHIIQNVKLFDRTNEKFYMLIAKGTKNICADCATETTERRG